MTQHHNLINGQWTPGKSYAPNTNPSDLADVIGEYAQGDASDVNAAVAAATAAFPAWSTSGIQARHDALEGAALLVNTTSQGMHGNPALDLDLRKLPLQALVSDVIYVPLETPLLAAARLRGNPTVNGLGMLLNQARPAFNAWFGVMPEITPELRQAIEATL